MTRDRRPGRAIARPPSDPPRGRRPSHREAAGRAAARSRAEPRRAREKTLEDLALRSVPSSAPLGSRRVLPPRALAAGSRRALLPRARSRRSAARFRRSAARSCRSAARSCRDPRPHWRCCACQCALLRCVVAGPRRWAARAHAARACRVLLALSRLVDWCQSRVVGVKGRGNLSVVPRRKRERDSFSVVLGVRLALVRKGLVSVARRAARVPKRVAESGRERQVVLQAVGQVRV